MLLLELFCGTKSISKVAKEKGINTITIDIIKRYKPDICIDILKWDYKNEPLLKDKKIDVVWASPPCTEFSLALTTRPRNIEKGMKNVRKAFEIINYYKTKNPALKWIVENPQGFLRKQEYMEQYNKITTSYCKYDYPYRKNTDFWFGGFELKLKPQCRWDCDQLIEVENKKKKKKKVHKARLCKFNTAQRENLDGQKYSDKDITVTRKIHKASINNSVHHPKQKFRDNTKVTRKIHKSVLGSYKTRGVQAMVDCKKDMKKAFGKDEVLTGKLLRYSIPVLLCKDIIKSIHFD